MGSDINLRFEHKNEHGSWYAFHIPDYLMPDERDYELFGFLAGVRDKTIEPQFEGRGIPDGSTWDDHPDFHSHTHAYLDEILAAPWKKVGLQRRYFFIFCEYILPRIVFNRCVFTNLEARNVRIVMAFDD